jgi:branched-chain amino acid transport system ATP-binding protein
MVGATVRARAGFGAALLGLPSSDRDERALREMAMAQLDELGVARHAGMPAGALPFGIRKRVALARALAGDPKLLLLDEPASGLGVDDVDELAELIRGLPHRPTPVAVMLVEHHMDLVMRVCDRLVVLDFGRVIAAGTPDEVRDDPVVNDAYLGTDVAEETGTAA